MPSLVAGGLVFVTAAAVLIFEILAVRLVAPFVGVTLQTYTAIIGTVLAGIASGTWVGGYAADRLSPRRMLGPLLVAGGGFSMLAVPIVRFLGPRVPGEGSAGLLLALAGFSVPSALLSAVSPTVVKLQLRDLAATGRVVGRLSGLGTAGAIAGTFFAGFVLVEVAPTTTSILAIGAVLVALGAVMWAWLWRGTAPRVAATAVVVVLLGLGAGVLAGNPCDVDTAYHCTQIVADPGRSGGRYLLLDSRFNSYVDVNDPTHLQFRYINVVNDLVASAAPPGALDVVHVGAGGFTYPRYIAATRPGSHNLVFEIDGKLAGVARDRLGLMPTPGIVVRAGDGRPLVGALPPASQDVIFGDAFSDLSVPWHLTTVEFHRSIHQALRPNGLYVQNIIDRGRYRFARAEVATIAATFKHVAVLAPLTTAGAVAEGNIILAASDSPFDEAAIRARIASRQGEEHVLTDGAALAFARGAPVITDDHAPIDQWLTRDRR